MRFHLTLLVGFLSHKKEYSVYALDSVDDSG